MLGGAKGLLVCALLSSCVSFICESSVDTQAPYVPLHVHVQMFKRRTTAAGSLRCQLESLNKPINCIFVDNCKLCIVYTEHVATN